MKRPATRTFQPKRLQRRDLGVQVTPGMRMLDAEDRQALVDRKTERLERYGAFGTLSKKRLTRCVLFAVLGLPLVTWIFGTAGVEAWLLQIPIGLVLGAIVAYWRPDNLIAGLLFLGGGLLSLALTGHLRISFFIVPQMLVFYVLGVMAALDEELRQTDGE